jgi:radical SAM protein with 4Fe4S-binding SPASM domain
LLGVEEIGVFLLGESFTEPDLLIKAIKHLKDIGTPYVFLTSNASLALPSVVSECMAAGLDSLKWSVNFYNETQFTEIAGVKDSNFKRALDNIAAAKKIRDSQYKTKLYASSIRYDDSQHERMKELLDKHIIPYVDQHYWLPLYSMGSAANKAGLNPVNGNTGRYDNQVAPIPCWSVFTEGHIMSDGRVTACGFDSTGDWSMGDMNYRGFLDCWHSQEFQELRKRHIEGDISGTKCDKCNG